MRRDSLNELVNWWGDNRSISAVVSVVLMVALVIILAAAIGFFLLDFGSDSEEPSFVQFETDYGNGELQLQHRAGDTLNPEEIRIIVESDDDRVEFDADDQLTERFGSGGRWQESVGLDLPLTVTIVHKPSNSILYSETIGQETGTPGGPTEPVPLAFSVSGGVSFNPPAEGVEVELLNESGESLDSDTTSADGTYTLEARGNVSGAVTVEMNNVEVDEIDEETHNDTENIEVDIDIIQDIVDADDASSVVDFLMDQAGDVYQVAYASDLQAMAFDLSSDYELAGDIDASHTAGWNDGDGFDPVGDDTDAFTGSFDGNANVIDGLTINRPSEERVALFGETDGTTIENVGLENADVTGEGYVGVLGGNIEGSSTVENSYATGEVTATGDSDADGTFSAGGLVAEITGDVVDSHAAVDVTASNLEQAGGLIGYHQANAGDIVRNSYATGDIDGDDRTGGLVGRTNGDIELSYATGNVEGDEGVGGLAGVVGPEEGDVGVEFSYATGDVDGDHRVAGLVGRMESNGEIVDSYVEGASVTGGSDAGGLIGSVHDEPSVTRSYADAAVGGDGGSIGGLIGWSNNAQITDTYALGTVTGSGASNVGGLIGHEGGGDVTTSYAAVSVGLISPADNVGGFAGKSDGSIEDSYWDNEVGPSEGVGDGSGDLTGLETSEMQGSGAADNMGAFDFGGTWETTAEYPELVSPANSLDEPQFIRIEIAGAGGGGGQFDGGDGARIWTLLDVRDGFETHRGYGGEAGETGGLLQDRDGGSGGGGYTNGGDGDDAESGFWGSDTTAGGGGGGSAAVEVGGKLILEAGGGAGGSGDDSDGDVVGGDGGGPGGNAVHWQPGNDGETFVAESDVVFDETVDAETGGGSSGGAGGSSNPTNGGNSWIGTTIAAVSNLQISAADTIIGTGETTDISVDEITVDPADTPVVVDDIPDDNVRWSVDAGTIDEDGTFTAPDETGMVTIEATYNNADNFESTTITIDVN